MLFEFYFQYPRQLWQPIKMHVIKWNIQKKKTTTANEKVPPAHKFKNVKQNLTSVRNTSTHIKTPILSRIMTKPTKWQVHPAWADPAIPRGGILGPSLNCSAIVAGLTNVTIPPDWLGPSLDCSVVTLCDIMVGYSEWILTRWTVMFLYRSPRFYSVMTLIVKKSSHSFKIINGIC